jgi:hypothetical protein
MPTMIENVKGTIAHLSIEELTKKEIFNRYLK